MFKKKCLAGLLTGAMVLAGMMMPALADEVESETAAETAAETAETETVQAQTEDAQPAAEEAQVTAQASTYWVSNVTLDSETPALILKIGGIEAYDSQVDRFNVALRCTNGDSYPQDELTDEDYLLTEADVETADEVQVEWTQQDGDWIITIHTDRISEVDGLDVDHPYVYAKATAVDAEGNALAEETVQAVAWAQIGHFGYLSNFQTMTETHIHGDWTYKTAGTEDAPQLVAICNASWARFHCFSDDMEMYLTFTLPDGKTYTYDGEAVEASLGTEEELAFWEELGPEVPEIIYGVQTADGKVGEALEAAPSDAGQYYAMVSVDWEDDGGETETTQLCLFYEIEKTDQAAPTGLEGTAPSSKTKADGVITGLDEDKTYQYSADEGKTWNDVPAGSTQISALAAGDYDVRLAETDYYNASESAVVTVPAYKEVSQGRYQDVARVAGTVKNITQSSEVTNGKTEFSADIANPDDLEKYLNVTSTEKEAGVNVWIVVKDIDDTVSDEDKELVKGKLGEYTLAKYLNVSLYMRIGDNNAFRVTKCGGRIKVSILLPEEFRADGRTYGVIRIHDGSASLLSADYDKDTHMLTFESDRFSTFAVVYTDSPKAAESQTETASGDRSNGTGTAQTGDDANPTLWVLLMAISAAAIAAGIVYGKKKKSADR